MRTKFYPLCLLAINVIYFTACNSAPKQAESGQTEQVREEITEDVTNPLDDQAIITFITEMYNNKSFEDDAFLEKHCTSEMLKRLQDEYEFEGGGYATWIFRSDAQDGPNERHEIISVNPEGDGWFHYEFYDMGNKGEHSIKIIEKDGELMIDGLK